MSESQVSLQPTDIERLAAIDDLVHFRKPIAEVEILLSKYPFDYDGDPYKFKIHHLLSAFERTKLKLLSFEELSKWADLLEFRDDLVFTGSRQEETDAVSNAIFLLANPELSDLSGIDLLVYLENKLASV